MPNSTAPPGQLENLNIVGFLLSIPTLLLLQLVLLSRHLIIDWLVSGLVRFSPKPRSFVFITNELTSRRLVPGFVGSSFRFVLSSSRFLIHAANIPPRRLMHMPWTRRRLP